MHTELCLFIQNVAYTDIGDDDVYLYGQMVFNEDQVWEVPNKDVSLVEKLTSGRFADIYRATQNCKKNNRKNVIAKLMKGMPLFSYSNMFTLDIFSHHMYIFFIVFFPGFYNMQYREIYRL